jgi:transposase
VIATGALPRATSHRFYERLNRLLDECRFDIFVESLCKRFYAKTLGRPGLAPGIYFRLLMVGYFEGIDSERGMAWRAADSLGNRAFLRIALDEEAPDHSTYLAHPPIDRCRNTPAGVCMAAGDFG